MRLPAWITATVRRYRALDIEYAALRVVGRGLFLAVMLMVAFLYVLARVTDLIAGTNEILVPTVTVDPSIDLGALAQGAFTRTSASVVSIIGIATLLLSALFTGHAVRAGSRRALLGDAAGRTRLLSGRTVAVSVLLAAGIFVTWLLTLMTAIRHRAWGALLDREVSPAVVDAGKIAAIAVSLLLIAAGVLLVVRLIMGYLPRKAPLGAAVVAVIVTVANFFLLYTYVGALINPQVSAGIVLIFTLLLWVNITVRAYLAALCWITVTAPARA
jgi:hypothetical protein